MARILTEEIPPKGRWLNAALVVDEGIGIHSVHGTTIGDFITPEVCGM